MRKFTRVAFIISVFIVRAAHAEEETVHLINGNVFSGELVEKIVGDHITIKLATGEVRKFEWTELAVQGNDAPPPAPTQPPLPTVSPLVLPPPIPTPPPRPAHVQFQSDTKGALLVRVDNVVVNMGAPPYTTETESPVCYAPCSADVDANARYYVRGAYIARSSRFAIRDGNSTLTAHTANAGVAAAGGWMLVLGILSTVAGAIATPIAFSTASGNVGWNGWEYYGVTSVIAGAGLILLSIPFLVAGRTHVTMGDIDVAHRTIHWLPNGFQF